jgi:hypothetical protein
MKEEGTRHSNTPEQPTQVGTIKETVTPKLRELGIQKLTIHYSGSGDEGSLGEIESEPEGIPLPEDLDDRLRELVEEFLYDQHGSWGDGEGATGKVVIDTTDNKVTNEHGWYVSDIDYSTLEF